MKPLCSIVLPSPPSPAPPTRLRLNTSTSFAHLKQIHAHLLRSLTNRSNENSFFSTLISSALSDTSPSSLDYAISALLLHAHLLSPTKSTTIRLFNLVIKDLTRRRGPRYALMVYARARNSGLELDRFSLPPVLSAAAALSVSGEEFSCGSGGAVALEAHGVAVKMGYEWDLFVQTAMVRAYASGGQMEVARQLFDRMMHRDLVAWGVMLDGYCHGGLYGKALQLFDEMRASVVFPDQVILATVLSACGRTANLRTGKATHGYIIVSGVDLNPDPFLRTSLITMYSNFGLMDVAQRLFSKLSSKDPIVTTAMLFGHAKLGDIQTARAIFDGMEDKDLVCWSAMMSVYAESDHPREALVLFDAMRDSGIKPDRISILSLISACAHLGAVDRARWVHNCVEENGFCDSTAISNALIDMYSKCGSLKEARKVFEDMRERNVITWTSMINGLAMHGEGRQALEMLERMKAEGVEPNGVTFVGLLYACSHAGLVEEGRRVFDSMAEEHGVEPKQEHYGCIVDLLGRAGRLSEAAELIRSMPFPPNAVIWSALLGACKLHGDVELGEFSAKKLLALQPDDDGAYVLLSNIYSKTARWDEVREVRMAMKSRRVSKEKGRSWIELDGGEVHEFLTGDESHARHVEIYRKLEEAVRELGLAGYEPDTSNVLVELEEEEERKRAVMAHSEKLALCLGLIYFVGKEKSIVRISKNLRVCEDCHNFMKIASRVYRLEIVLRDRTRFHHLKGGYCSCKDYW